MGGNDLTSLQEITPLQELEWHWKPAYTFTCRGDQWIATRADNGRELSADTPEQLRALVLDDYRKQPVPR